jgi:hypothetical protein
MWLNLSWIVTISRDSSSGRIRPYTALQPNGVEVAPLKHHAIRNMHTEPGSVLLRTGVNKC